MKKNLNKWIAGFMIVTSSAAAVSPMRANAALVSSVAVAPAVFAAGIVVGIGVGLTGLYEMSQASYYNNKLSIGWVALLAGILILDEKDGQKVSFSRVSDSKADELGLSSSELRSYNHDVKLINQITDSIAAEVASNPSMSQEQAQKLADRRMEKLSPETHSALSKIRAYANERSSQ